LFWAGLVPTLVGLALVAVVLGAAWWAVLGLLLIYNAVRLATALWALRTGLAAGVRVGSAIAASWVPTAVARIGPVAGASVGLALPLVAGWYLKGFGWGGGSGALAVAAAGLAMSRWFGPLLTSVRFALLAMALLLLFRWAGL
jgi:hypothetical protein